MSDFDEWDDDFDEWDDEHHPYRPEDDDEQVESDQLSRWLLQIERFEETAEAKHGWIDDRVGVIRCPECRGFGQFEGLEGVVCPDCYGSGEIICPKCRGTGYSGTGYLDVVDCPTCMSPWFD